MRARRTPIEATIVPYELNKGLEDGFESYADIITKGWFITDNLVKVTRENGLVVCPYINHRRGRTFICEGDYLIIDDDLTKHVCSSEKIFNRYEPIDSAK